MRVLSGFRRCRNYGSRQVQGAADRSLPVQVIARPERENSDFYERSESRHRERTHGRAVLRSPGSIDHSPTIRLQKYAPEELPGPGFLDFPPASADAGFRRQRIAIS